MKISCVVVLLLFACRLCLALPSTPGLEVQAYRGGPAKQEFITLVGRPRETKQTATGLSVRYGLRDKTGGVWRISFEADMTRTGDTCSWRYRITNEEPDATVCGVVFPVVRNVLIGGKWTDNRILWPGRYVGALIDDLKSAEQFEKQCRDAAKAYRICTACIRAICACRFSFRPGKTPLFP